MKPFYQGKIDTFCAFYAVLNAFRLTHGIRTLKARSLFHDVLQKVAEDRLLFRQVLDQTTDYFSVVDAMIEYCSRFHPATLVVPFPQTQYVSRDLLWKTLLDWIRSRRNSTAVFRFKRYIQPQSSPSVRHWTTIEGIDEQSLRLYDSSHEADAIRTIQKDRIVTRSEDVVSADLIYVQPTSVRLLCLKGALEQAGDPGLGD